MEHAHAAGPPTGSPTDAAEEARKKRQEVIFGVTLAIFAAVLAVCDLGGGKYGGDQILAANEKATAYAWYQSKSVKQSLVEGQAELLESMIATGSVDDDREAGLRKHLADLKRHVARYEQEKNEILLGSQHVGEANWVQEVDGRKGQVVGAKEWEAKVATLDAAGDRFDNATLFLQMTLVLGAIGLVMQDERLKRLFYWTMVGLGVIGAVVTFLAYQTAWAAG
jgi:hypothetical protein